MWLERYFSELLAMRRFGHTTQRSAAAYAVTGKQQHFHRVPVMSSWMWSSSLFGQRDPDLSRPERHEPAYRCDQRSTGAGHVDIGDPADQHPV